MYDLFPNLQCNVSHTKPKRQITQDKMSSLHACACSCFQGPQSGRQALAESPLRIATENRIMSIFCLNHSVSHPPSPMSSYHAVARFVAAIDLATKEDQTM